MPEKLAVVRPRGLFPNTQAWKDLENYLVNKWLEAEEARRTNVDVKYSRWMDGYEGIPKEKTRSIPWSGASNIVVPLSRIFIDTFVARTLNVLFATRPLIAVPSLRGDIRESYEMYLNIKVSNDWKYYRLVRDVMGRGNRAGTAVTKVIWKHDTVQQWLDETSSTEVVRYSGPYARVISYHDFYVYPYTANYLEDADIKFHKVRATAERARRMMQNAEVEGGWRITEEELTSALSDVPDVIKTQRRDMAIGISDPHLRQAEMVECDLDWDMDGEMTAMVCVLSPKLQKLVDVYYDPYVQQKYHDYRPFPQDDIFYGQSCVRLLEMLQEEATSIHNERRDNARIANSPIFKRRSGSLLPNPSTNWYPGKVWDLDSLDDLAVEAVGRQIDSMIDQEMHTFQLAELLLGIGPIMQGQSAGVTGKRGIYSASGTMAVLSESNQRQDTNIRDVRSVVGGIVHASAHLQGRLGSDDPLLAELPEPHRENVMKAFKTIALDRQHSTIYEVSASTAGMNKGIERQNLIQIANVLAQYGNAAQAFSQQLAVPGLNPGLKAVMMDIIKMHKWIAVKLTRAFDNYDAEGVFPDVLTALNLAPGGPTEGDFGGVLEQGAPTGAESTLSRDFLATISGLPVPS